MAEVVEQLDFAYEELSFMKDSIAQLIKTGKWHKAMLDRLEGFSTVEESVEDFMDLFVREMGQEHNRVPKKKIRNTRRPRTTPASKY